MQRRDAAMQPMLRCCAPPRHRGRQDGGRLGDPCGLGGLRAPGRRPGLACGRLGGGLAWPGVGLRPPGRRPGRRPGVHRGRPDASYHDRTAVIPIWVCTFACSFTCTFTKSQARRIPGRVSIGAPGGALGGALGTSLGGPWAGPSRAQAGGAPGASLGRPQDGPGGPRAGPGADTGRPGRPGSRAVPGPGPRPVGPGVGPGPSGGVGPGPGRGSPSTANHPVLLRRRALQSDWSYCERLRLLSRMSG